MPDTREPEWQAVCQMEDLQADRFVEFTIKEETEDAPEITGFVFARNGAVKAYLNRCPHLGIELNWMPGRFMDSDKCFIQCATHGALFVPDDGQCIAGPCQGDSLSPLATRVKGDSVLVKLTD